MPQGPGDPAPAVTELDQLLLDAKFSVPRLRPGSVSRADLIETGRASGCRVVGVTAPAGYGKSTLLAQWADAEDRRVAWVSLDRYDDDPAHLLGLLASAYTRVSSGSPDLIADMSGLGLSPLGRAAPRLASALRSSPVPFVLILDDLHELRSPACHDVLGVVISGIPDGSQLVAASRSEQPHLPRLRASGDALELDARRPRARRGRGRADLRAGPCQPHPRGCCRGDRADRGLAGRPLPRRGDRAGQRRRGAGRLRRRPVRHRLPVPRAVGPSSRGHPAVPATHRRARPAVCSALRCRPRRVSARQERLRDIEASNLFLVPLGPPAGVVPLPRTVPGVPAR